MRTTITDRRKDVIKRLEKQLVDKTKRVKNEEVTLTDKDIARIEKELYLLKLKV